MDAWTVRKQDEQRLATDEMTFMSRTAGYSLLDHMRNEHILDKMKVTHQWRNMLTTRDKTGCNV
jgi:hypothetical protein